ncbi:MAG TPA: methyltransferase domain-containing protein [Microlunatus sp.]
MTGPTSEAARLDFSTFEAQGWEQAALGYDALVGAVARRLDEGILAAAAIGPASRVLEIGCGPGHLSGAAAARGASVVGLDVAQAMVDLARRRYPAVEVRRGTAEDLPFADGRFDAVVGNLVVLHLAQPRAAVVEAARVLGSGGRLVLTTWDLPERCRLLGVMLEALTAAGATAAAEIPNGPAFFHFADDAVFAELLSSAGFRGVSVRRIAFDQTVPTAEALWDGIVEGSVRTSALIRHQSADVRDRARAALIEALGPYRSVADEPGYRLPVSMKLVSGRRSPVNVN